MLNPRPPRPLVFLLLVVLQVWSGGIVFLSFLVAPALFGQLAPEEAGRTMSLLFPPYYTVGMACGALTSILGVVLARQQKPGAWHVVPMLSLLLLGLTAWAGLIVQPRAAALRSELRDPERSAVARPEFDRLHRRAEQLNAAVLVGTLVLTGVLTLALLPRGTRPAS